MTEQSGAKSSKRRKVAAVVIAGLALAGGAVLIIVPVIPFWPRLLMVVCFLAELESLMVSLYHGRMSLTYGSAAVKLKGTLDAASALAAGVFGAFFFSLWLGQWSWVVAAAGALVAAVNLTITWTKLGANRGIRFRPQS